MKEIGQMILGELQKMIDDSLFSEIAWMPSQIQMRESLRKEIYDRRRGEGINATEVVGRPITGDRRPNYFRDQKVNVMQAGRVGSNTAKDIGVSVGAELASKRY